MTFDEYIEKEKSVSAKEGARKLWDIAFKLGQESRPIEAGVMPTLTGDLEEDLQIIYKNGKPYGIRDKSGYLLLFVDIAHYTGQDKRYQEEIDQQNKLADYLLTQLSKCSA